jgi:tetratricopeptide (TPR) repeat protein
VSLLAYHYAEAVRPEDADLVWGDDDPELERLRAEAVRWLRRAAELAHGRYEMEEAIALLELAIELTADEHERALLWRECGRAHFLRYDGEGFWAAMHRALEGPLDEAERAETYAELAFQTSIRSGMWVVRPEAPKVIEWVDRALELAADGSVAQAQALLARCHSQPEDVPEDLLQRATRLAEELGLPGLRSHAFGARSHAAFARHRFDEAATWSERRLELLPWIDDPDELCEAYESAVPVAVLVGRYREARRLTELHWELARRLSAHHRVHSVSLVLERAELLADWQEIVDETERVSIEVESNRATYCVRNARDLFVCALGHLCLGDEARARELETAGARMVGEGHERALSGPRLRLALVRGDADSARRFVETALMRTFVWGPAVFAARLDGLVALREHGRIEEEAPSLNKSGTVIEPFALRALGAARRDDELLARAQERFEALRLGWHAAQTERLLEGM